MRKILVIWSLMEYELEPFAYLINDPTDEQVELLRKANGQIVNCTEESEEALILCAAFEERENIIPEVEEKWCGIWHDCRVEFPIVNCEGIDMIIFSGFC